MQRLNLGCNHNIRRGWINVDQQAFPGVDVAHDLDVTPWPFKDGQFCHISAIDIFEHLNDVTSAMDECWRVLRPGGTLTIQGPLANGSHHWIDPTHKRAFLPGSFDYYCENTPRGQRYGYGVGRWARLAVKVENDNVIFALKRLE